MAQILLLSRIVKDKRSDKQMRNPPLMPLRHKGAYSDFRCIHIPNQSFLVVRKALLRQLDLKTYHGLSKLEK